MNYRRRRGAAPLAFAALAVTFFLAAPLRAAPEDPVTLELLEQQVKSGDWDAQASAAKLGAAAGPLLAGLAAARSPEAREQRLLALTCLVIAGGDEARRVGLEALEDLDEQVSGLGLQLLRAHPGPGLQPRLLERYRSSRDPLVLDELPKIAASCPDARPEAWVAAERARRGPGAAESSESDLLAAAPNGLLAALGRLGHATARALLVDRTLQAASGVEELLACCRFAGGPDVARGLLPLLEREERAKRIGGHGRERYLRTCDLAAGVIVELAALRVDFPTGGTATVTPEQRAAIRRALSAQPAPGRGIVDQLER